MHCTYGYTRPVVLVSFDTLGRYHVGVIYIKLIKTY